MDYDKIYLAYKNLGMGKRFEEHQDFSRYKKEQGWYERVKSPRATLLYVLFRGNPRS